MGMYRTINGTQVKWSGLLAQAGANMGISCDDGVVHLDHTQVVAVVMALTEVLDETKISRILQAEYGWQELLGYSRAVDTLVILVEWLSANPTGELVFA